MPAYPPVADHRKAAATGPAARVTDHRDGERPVERGIALSPEQIGRHDGAHDGHHAVAGAVQGQPSGEDEEAIAGGHQEQPGREQHQRHHAGSRHTEAAAERILDDPPGHLHRTDERSQPRCLSSSEAAFRAAG